MVSQVFLLVTLFLFGKSYCQSAPVPGYRLSVRETGMSEVFIAPYNDRNISLTPGLGYIIKCTRNSGFTVRPVNRRVNPWYRGGRNSRNRVSQSSSQSVFATYINRNNWELVFRSFTSSQAGDYSCDNRQTGDSVTFEILSSNPAVTPSDPTVHAIRGPRTNGLVLRCFVAGLPPPSGGTWRYNGGPLPSSVVDLLFGEIMLGTNINSSHAGRYTFTVTTSEGTATANIDVATFSPPGVLISVHEDQDLPLGSRFTVECSDNVGSPPSEISWLYNGEPFTMTRPGVTIAPYANSTHSGSVLTFNSLIIEDSGTYECVASSSSPQIANSSQSIRIFVYRFPSAAQILSVRNLSPCRAEINFTADYLRSVDVRLVAYVFDIQFLVDTMHGEWRELIRGRIPPLRVTIPFNGADTTYFLRVYGIIDERHGNTSVSGPFGPYVAYPSDQISALARRYIPQV